MRASRTLGAAAHSGAVSAAIVMSAIVTESPTKHVPPPSRAIARSASRRISASSFLFLAFERANRRRIARRAIRPFPHPAHTTAPGRDPLDLDGARPARAVSRTAPGGTRCRPAPPASAPPRNSGSFLESRVGPVAKSQVSRVGADARYGSCGSTAEPLGSIHPRPWCPGRDHRIAGHSCLAHEAAFA